MMDIEDIMLIVKTNYVGEHLTFIIHVVYHIYCMCSCQCQTCSIQQYLLQATIYVDWVLGISPFQRSFVAFSAT
jgi:hypothetical protein